MLLQKIIDKIGSDYVEERITLNKYELRAKNFDDFKDKLMNVNEIKQNIISQLPPQPMSQPPMGFTPPAMFPYDEYVHAASSN